jgi:hypothetical protein
MLRTLGIDDRVKLLIESRDVFVYDDGVCTRMSVIGKWSPAYATLCERFSVTALTLSTAQTFRPKDFANFAKLKALKELSISVEKGSDCELLETLVGLKKLSVFWADSPPTLRLDRLTDLECLKTNWHPVYGFIFEMKNLRELALKFYDKPLIDLGGMSQLDGLGLFGCRKLATIRCSGNRLRTLVIADCHRLSEITPSSSLARIQYLDISGKFCIDFDWVGTLRWLEVLILNRCGILSSLDFLNNCRELQVIRLLQGVRVKDGDMTVLKELPKLRTKDCIISWYRDYGRRADYGMLE